MRASALLRGRPGLALRAPGLVGPELAGAALADWLFWDRGVGLSLPLFCFATAVAAWVVRPNRVAPRRRALAAVVLLAALAPAVERATPLSAAFALLGTALSIQLCAARDPSDWPSRLRAAALRLISGPSQAFRDAARRRIHPRRLRAPASPAAGRVAWVAPLGLLGGFLTLFAEANPLIAHWLAHLPIPSWADIAGALPRGLFWAVLMIALWPALRPRRPPRAASARSPDAGPEAVPDAWMADTWRDVAALFLSPPAVLRALVLLDALFALQLGLDGAFLTGGVALPERLSYADYAHRGAYPLIVTALLAAALVLVVRRRGAPPPGRLASALLLVFLAQNVLLVLTAIERLALYVGAYGLTELRLAAFAWMGLVAVGLGLIALQGVLGRDARWLVGRCALAATALLYGWCFLDAPRVVADYDVAHCAELRGSGPGLDIDAIEDLGPGALPAMDRYLVGFAADARRPWLEDWRRGAAADLRREAADWRRWSWRGWRLARYLDASGVAEPAPGGEGER